MSRTHDVTISAFDLDRLEASLTAWRDVAHQLAFAVEGAQPGPFPGSFDSSIRCAALEAYARLNAAATEPYEL